MQESSSFTLTPCASNDWLVGPIGHLHGIPSILPRGIHTLPTELLSTIFLHLVPILHIGAHESDGEIDWLYINSVMLVCRGWRATALSYPLLWTCVFPRNVSRTTWIRTLRLSACLPLDLVLDMEFVTSGMLADFDANILRTRSLTVLLSVNSHEDDLQIIADAFQEFPACQLELLSINPRLDVSPTCSVAIPRLFEEDCLSALTSFCAFSSVHDWPDGMFKNLTELIITNIHVQYIEATLDNLLDLLNANCATLRMIVLWNAFVFVDERDEEIDGEGGESRAPDKISLPNLHDIRIIDNAPYVKPLLSSLILPSTASFGVDIRYDNEDLEEANVNMILAAFSNLVEMSSCAAGLLPNLTRLVVKTASRSKLSLMLCDDESRTRLSVEVIARSRPCALTFADRISNTLVDLGSPCPWPFTFAAPPPLPTDEIYEITLALSSYAYLITLDTWCAFFKGFPNLNTLHLAVISQTIGIPNNLSIAVLLSYDPHRLPSIETVDMEPESDLFDIGISSDIPGGYKSEDVTYRGILERG